MPPQAIETPVELTTDSEGDVSATVALPAGVLFGADIEAAAATSPTLALQTPGGTNLLGAESSGFYPAKGAGALPIAQGDYTLVIASGGNAQDHTVIVRMIGGA